MLSLIAIDLDRFSDINARFFIPGGDSVIASISRLVSLLSISPDLAARDGGDQFSLILPATESASARQEAERIRKKIARNPIRVRDEVVEITASVGVATATFTEAEPWELYLRARNAVHQAKDLGGNRVAVG